MLWLLVTTTAAASQQLPQAEQPQTAKAVVQARATIRILSAARVSLSEEADAVVGDAPAMRDSTVRSQGSAVPAKLVEFQ